jgi:hypothetical protein
MELFNAMDLKNGARSEQHYMGTLQQPIQFIPKKEKNQEWASWNLDWLEWQGLKQVQLQALKLLKNYKLAKGIIDKSDYIVEEDNEAADLIDVLTKEDTSALELKFYPIIPNVVNTLVSEFAKRFSQITFRCVDDTSYNEMLEMKRSQIEEVLLSDAYNKIQLKLVEAGLDPASDEFKQEVDPEKLKTLPEIEKFFRKDYISLTEQWAEHQKNADVERFYMEELEERGFRDMLITDREFWHFKMYEDDYDVELWNPVLTFYQKSPDRRYVSEGNWVGKFDMMSAADAIDKYGWIMNEDQMLSLQRMYPVRNAAYLIPGMQNDGSYYDATQSKEWNTNKPSLQYRQFMTMWGDNLNQGGDIVQWILNSSEDYLGNNFYGMLRVTTVYWKSQVRYGHLTKIDETGNVLTTIVDEDYKVTDKPIYNTSLVKTKSKENLIFGEHIDWIWINQTWGGVKIGPNRPSFWESKSEQGFNPIYLGINQNNIKPLKFQFKGDNNLYGCKLPVEGSIFSDRNTKSTSLVDLMKPFQIAYNMVNNQIADILIDELGTVIMLDQNSLPRHSLGEDWGKGNYAKAYVAMKNFQMLPLDTSITNTENALNFNHFQKLDMAQTERLMSRIQLATYFKQQAFEVIGVNQQRMGAQPISQQTATEVNVAVSASYAQTESYFIQHSDYLMPRVHQMRTDLAQYYQSTKPSIRLQYLTSTDEKKNFEINGTELLLRDINVFATTRANNRAVVEQLKQLAASNNTAGASIYDLGNIIKSTSISEIDQALKEVDHKTQQVKQQEMAHQKELEDMRIKAAAAEKQAEREFTASESAKDRQADLLGDQIKAAGYGAMQDLDQNMQSDYQDVLADIQKSEQFQETMNMDNTKENNKQQMHQDKLNLAREEMRTKERIANNTSQTALKIAQENKNRFDKKSKSDTKKK